MEWGGGKEKIICWKRWDELCKSKWEGGLGFRNREVSNIALLAKQGWQLLQNP